MEEERSNSKRCKEKQLVKHPSQSRPPHATTIVRSPTEAHRVKVAATAAISLDMPTHMQDHALYYTRSLVDSAPKHPPNHSHLARALKKEFDSLYGPAWHCVVGTSYGSFVTHSPGGFVYFSIDSLFVLLFKTEVQLVTELETLKML
ncbi:Dynein_light domain-containing protein [Cephalotus follicularis]|uniref:Dynein light chain n=1 Tax=Cephalotus follicularis TaxID=3775 RepID=A0A1Q3D1D0_CEPFO|nr:Dynein_light domain-containing protein [Cephalotus follicularis]